MPSDVFTISGRVLSGEGAPLDGIGVTALFVSDGSVAAESISANGSYNLQLAPGRYRILLQDYNEVPVYPDLYLGGNDEPTIFIVTSASLQLGDLSIAPAAQTLTATIAQPAHAEVGSTLTHAILARPAPGVSTTVQWIRDGVVAESKLFDPSDWSVSAFSYRLTPADAGHMVGMRVTGRQAGHADAVTDSDLTSVGRMVSRTTAALGRKTIHRHTRTSVTAHVTTTPDATALGQVRVTLNGRSSARAALVSTSHGVANLRLPALRAGWYQVRVYYAGSAQVVASSSYAGKLHVVR